MCAKTNLAHAGGHAVSGHEAEVELALLARRGVALALVQELEHVRAPVPVVLVRLGVYGRLML